MIIELTMYNNAVISLTNKCNAECSVCCFSCSPTKSETLSREKVLEVIKKIGSENLARGVFFTGGEPFLFYDDLKEYLVLARRYNLEIGVYTNGYWAKTYETTYSILKDLKEIGLLNLRTSCDAYHQKFVNIEYLKNILKVANELNIVVNISATIARSTEKKTSDIIASLGVSKLNSSITYTPLLPFGKAKGIPNEDLLITKNIKNNYCKHNGFFTILYNGEVYPCCSQGIVDVGFSFGNIYNRDIVEIVGELNESTLMKKLSVLGFDWALEKLIPTGTIDDEKKYVDVCHLCYDIFEKTKNLNYFKKISNILGEK